MVNKTLLLDRFGDIDFLHELWTKASREIPDRLRKIEPAIQQVRDGSDDAPLAKMLHKLRGLISNFLTEKEAMSALVHCEKSLERQDLEEVTRSWAAFKGHLQAESIRLDAWLAQEGFEKLG